MAGYRNITYDDTRFDVLKYAGSWTNNGSYNATSVGETGTLSSTKDPTANVTFIFPESANAFYYYGIPRCCGGLYAICIDCDFDSLNSEPVDAVNRTDDGKNPPVVLYSKAFDTPGVHKITLTNQNDTRFPGGNSQLTLDRFVIQVEDNSSSASISSTSTSGASSSIPETSLIAPEASQSTTASSPASEPPIGAIVGGVLGGIAAISLCLIIWFFMRRRHHTQHSTQPEHNTNTSFYTNPNQYSPFIVPRANTQTPTAYTVTDATSEYTSRRTNRASVVGGPSVSDPSSRRTHPSSSRMASSERPPRRETDAGRIDVDDDDDFGTLPPGYEDIFSGGRLNGEQSESVTRGPSRRLPRPEPQRPLPSPSGQPPSQLSKF